MLYKFGVLTLLIGFAAISVFVTSIADYASDSEFWTVIWCFFVYLFYLKFPLTLKYFQRFFILSSCPIMKLKKYALVVFAINNHLPFVYEHIT